MKICFLGNGESPNIQYRVECFAKNHEVSLISFHGFKERYSLNVKKYQIDIPLNKNVNVSYLPVKLFELKKALDEIKKILKDVNPDIVHAFYITHYGFLGALSGHHPFIVSTLGSDLRSVPSKSFIYKYMTRYALKNLDLIHVQDPLSKLKAKQLGLEKEKIFTNPWGIDTDIHHPVKKQKKYDIIRIRPFRKSYNERTFAKAIKIVESRFPDLNVLSLGGGDAEDDFKKLSNNLGILDNIVFEGWVNHNKIRDFLYQSKIFIDPFYPKNNQLGSGYGVALHQAMACGIPTIVAKRPTVCKLDGEEKWYYGYTYKTNDPKDLATKLIELLGNKDKREEISSRNRQIMVEKFDINKNIERIVEKYDNLL